MNSSAMKPRRNLLHSGEGEVLLNSSVSGMIAEAKGEANGGFAITT